MKTAIVISDSHGNRAAIEKLDPLFAESDYIFHLGDTCDDGGAIRRKYPEKTFVVNGNCDFYKLGEDEIVTEIEGVKILACHGHRYSVKRTIEPLISRAEELGCKIALYGHTHIAQIEERGGVTAVNPGNLSRYSENSYCYIVFHGGKAVAKIVEI